MKSKSLKKDSDYIFMGSYKYMFCYARNDVSLVIMGDTYRDYFTQVITNDEMLRYIVDDDYDVIEGDLD